MRARFVVTVGWLLTSSVGFDALPSFEAVAWAAPKRKDDESTKRAFDLFDKSAESYRAGRFTEAADMLREAYRLHPAGILLYNLARALEGAGDLKGAIEAYRSYLDAKEKILDRKSIETRVANLEKTLAEQEQLRIQREQAETERREAESKLERERKEADEKLARERRDAEERVAAARAGREDRPMSKSRVAAPWIVAGTGALGLVAGAVLAVESRKKHDQAVGDAGAVQASNDQQSAKSFALGANIAFGVGGGIVAGGVVWGIVDVVRRHRAEERRKRLSASR